MRRRLLRLLLLLTLIYIDTQQNITRMPGMLLEINGFAGDSRIGHDHKPTERTVQVDPKYTGSFIPITVWCKFERYV